MKTLMLRIVILASVGMLGVTSKPKQLCEGFVPENHLNIPVGFAASGISEAEWTALFDKYEKIYSPIISSRGGTLQLNRLWDDGTVNANASEDGTTWTINMYGGLARYDGMTVDGMALVVCHETGHHLGGAPRWYNDPTQWAANEGGADYFATLKCAHLMFKDDDNVGIVSKLTIDPKVKTSCDASYADANESAICQRSAAAGVVLGTVLAGLGGDPAPSIATPDTSVVTETITDGYPGTQCRMDTYFNAALCTADITVFQGPDYHTGTCTNPTFKTGLRPACWFAPDAADASGGNSNLAAQLKVARPQAARKTVFF